MDIWKLLDIPPTNDIAAIKSAYARQAKLYHPEEQPEEFKALQRAYKLAVQAAKRQGTMPYVPPVQMPEPDVKEPEEMPAGEPETAQVTDSSAGEPEEEEHYYDYRGVDAHGEREQFFKQFRLLEKNPYAKNNIDAWDYFLNGYSELFVNTQFRKNFVKTVCNYVGWQWKTILYFKRYLLRFHTQDNEPSDGKWETEFFWFRARQFPLPKLPVFLTGHFWTKEGKDFQERLLAKVASLIGRKPDLKRKDDMIEYMKVYLDYGESKADYIGCLRDAQGQWQGMVNGAILMVCIFIVLAASHSIEQRREAKELSSRADYFMELYNLESDRCSDEELKEIIGEYDRYWRYAEEAIDDAMERHEEWDVQ